MAIAVITGSAGLVGAEAVGHFAGKGFQVAGVDNDSRSYFFGSEASTSWQRAALQKTVPGYTHFDADVRDEAAIDKIFSRYGKDIAVVIHTAAQPSHDWAAREPLTDFTINANGTLVLLEATRKHCPEAVFVFTSTNKVYGDTANRLPLVEQETRWELDPSHRWAEHGIDESMSIDRSLHSLFGASKAAADLLVQEYGRYFGIKSACFRAGCITGPGHSGAQLHGFLAYLMKCAMTGDRYTVFGYKGKQVRDNIHAKDLVSAFWHFYEKPRVGEVYNIGGGRHSNCSMLEAIELAESVTQRRIQRTYSEENRTGDHVWWISDTRKFREHYPDWKQAYDLPRIVREIHAGMSERLAPRQDVSDQETARADSSDS